MQPTTVDPRIHPAPSLRARAATIVRDIGDIASDHLELAILEAQRAGIGLAKLLATAVVVAVLFATAWLALVAGAIVWATATGVSWVAALAVAATLNLVAAGVLVVWVRGEAGELLFAATLRQLRHEINAMEEAHEARADLGRADRHS